MKQLLVIGLFLSLIIGGYGVYKAEKNAPVESTQLGAFAPVGGTTYRLQSSIGLANTSLTLSSFKSRSGIPWTMSMLNTDIIYATLDPQSTNSEFISFTGIAQNADGTATISGITRGLSDFYPFTASSTMQRPHAGQAIFILSDPPQLFNEYAAKRNNNVFTGFINFVSGVGFDTAATSSDECTAANEYCTKQYIDSGLNQGAATSTETNIGLVELATNNEIAAGTASSSATGPLVPPNKYFNATQTSCNSVACIPIAVAGKISQLFLDLTQHFNFTSIFATSASSTNATTTSQYILGTLSSILKTDSTGKVTAASAATDYQAQKYVFASATDIVTGSASCTNNCSAASYATSTTGMTIPSGVLNASSTVTYVAHGTCSENTFTGSASGSGSFSLRTSDGTPIVESAIYNTTDKGGFTQGVVSFVAGSLSSQIYTTAVTLGTASASTGTGSVDLTGTVTLYVVIRTSVSAGTGETANMNSCTMDGFHIVVEP